VLGLINLNDLNKWRIPDTPYEADGKGGAFMIPYPLGGIELRCIATNGGGWDHVSVSLAQRTPTWAEMSYIKHTFFLPTETAMQLHVPENEHINVHPYCLHLWRPHKNNIPKPPKVYV
jgi:hypothetical protein